MIKKLFSLILILLLADFTVAQINITKDDMPVPGDTIRTSTTLFLGGLDYEATGPDHVWDFSSLTVMSQTVDTFVAVSETPILYQWYFNNSILYPDYKATVAAKQSGFDPIPGFQVTDPYLFYKASDDDYSEVGFGVGINELTLPVKYDDIDFVYRFPMIYENEDSSFSSVNMDVPAMGTYFSTKDRHNEVDGWGTLITPFGTFEVLRVKTEIERYDSIWADSLGIGFHLDREYTEYKWMGNDYGIPLLQVTAEGILVFATYIDSVRNYFYGVEESETSDKRFHVFPNPCHDYLVVDYELTGPSRVEISIYTITGQRVMTPLRESQGKGIFRKRINLSDLSTPAGVYLIRLSINDLPVVRRIIIR